MRNWKQQHPRQKSRLCCRLRSSCLWLRRSQTKSRGTELTFDYLSLKKNCVRHAVCKKRCPTEASFQFSTKWGCGVSCGLLVLTSFGSVLLLGVLDSIGGWEDLGWRTDWFWQNHSLVWLCSTFQRVGCMFPFGSHRVRLSSFPTRTGWK